MITIYNVSYAQKSDINPCKKTNFIQVNNDNASKTSNPSGFTSVDTINPKNNFNRNDLLFIYNVESFADDIMLKLNDIKSTAKVEYSRAFNELQNRTIKITADEDKKMVMHLAKQVNSEVDKDTDDEKSALRNYYMKKEQWFIPKEIVMKTSDGDKNQVVIVEKDDFGYPYISKIIQDNGKTGKKRAMNIFSFSKDNVLLRYDDNVNLISDKKAQAKRSYVFVDQNNFECRIGQIFDENGDKQKPMQKYVFKDELLSEFHYLHTLPNGEERILKF